MHLTRMTLLMAMFVSVSATARAQDELFRIDVGHFSTVEGGGIIHMWAKGEFSSKQMPTQAATNVSAWQDFLPPASRHRRYAGWRG